MDDRKKILYAWLDKYGPLPILTTSFGLGWLITFMIEEIIADGRVQPPPLDNIEVATRLLVLTLSWLGWSWGLILKEKTLYHSGKYKINPRQRTRYELFFGLGLIFPLVILPLSLILAARSSNETSTFYYCFFYAIIFPIIGIIISEVKTDSPFGYWKSKLRIIGLYYDDEDE